MENNWALVELRAVMSSLAVVAEEDNWVLKMMLVLEESNLAKGANNCRMLLDFSPPHYHLLHLHLVRNRRMTTANWLEIISNNVM